MPYLYDLENDDLYELSPEAFQFLMMCSQGNRPSFSEKDHEFIKTCFDQDLITLSETPDDRRIFHDPSPVPSLRYLELLITDRCNLRCSHCYLGNGSGRDLTLEQIKRVLEEFEEIQGLRLLISGGEPLLHPEFWEINRLLKGRAFRSILISNGTMITPKVAKALNANEVQISLDGMEKGHESIRGKGSFRKAVEAIEHLQKAGIRVSVASMIHRYNLGEFEALKALIREKDISEWNVDVPCEQGRLEDHPELYVDPLEAAPFLAYGYGGGVHASEGNLCCGAHLCAVMPDGAVTKCSLFREEAAGLIEEGLRHCWQKIDRIPLNELECDCEEIETCRGGCRYRAKTISGPFGPDLYQCYARGIREGGERHENQESL